MTTENKKHGGHQTGLRKLANSVGHGPLYEIRLALDYLDKRDGGPGWSQQRLATAIGVSVLTVKRCEANSTLPQSKAACSLLHELALVMSEADGKTLMAEIREKQK